MIDIVTLTWQLWAGVGCIATMALVWFIYNNGGVE